jgi:hypothetical protein
MKRAILTGLMISYSLFLIFPSASNAQGTAGVRSPFYFEETFFPTFTKLTDSNQWAVTADVPSESSSGLDARTTLGYVWHNVLMGLTYNIEQYETKAAFTADAEGFTKKTSTNEFGPTLGYFLGSFRFAMTFFMSGSRTYSETYYDAATGVISARDRTFKNTGVGGYQFALGYDFNIGAGFSISPTLVYRTVTYSKQSNEDRFAPGSSYASSSLATKFAKTDLKPMITISFGF